MSQSDSKIPLANLDINSFLEGLDGKKSSETRILFLKKFGLFFKNKRCLLKMNILTVSLLTKCQIHAIEDFEEGKVFPKKDLIKSFMKIYSVSTAELISVIMEIDLDLGLFISSKLE